MKGFERIAFASALILGVGLNSAFAVDACSETGGHSGSGTTTQGSNNSSVTGYIGNSGYHYEIWYQGGNNSMTYYNDGTFSAQWNGSSDFLARVGFKYNSDKTYDQIGYLTADYKFTKSGSASYSYIGIYGWTKNPLVEYYIVDDWFTKPSTSYLGTKKGEIEVDGDIYDIYTYTRVQQPSIEGTSTFPQYFSVRRTARQCGHIDITAHFKKWEELGLQMGKLYEAKVLAEAGGNATGKIDFTYFAMSENGEPSGENEPEVEIPRQAYKGVKAKIPGIIEAENYDEGNNGDAYYDESKATEETAVDYRGEGYYVDIVKGGTGYAVGYTTAQEWLEYTVDVETAGEYDIAASVSNGSGNSSLILTMDGKDLATLSFNETEDWDTYTTTTGKAALTAGEHVLRIAIGADNTNIDYLKFSLQGSSVTEMPSSSETPTSSDSKIVDPTSSTTALPSIAEVVLTDRSMQVFDMQGRFLGKMNVAAGSSVGESLRAEFHASGVYLVKYGARMQRFAVK